MSRVGGMSFLIYTCKQVNYINLLSKLHTDVNTSSFHPTNAFINPFSDRCKCLSMPMPSTKAMLALSVILKLVICLNKPLQMSF